MSEWQKWVKWVNPNATTAYVPAIWQRNKGICHGEQTVINSRITRAELRNWCKKCGTQWVIDNYSHIPIQNIIEA